MSPRTGPLDLRVGRPAIEAGGTVPKNGPFSGWATNALIEHGLHRRRRSTTMATQTAKLIPLFVDPTLLAEITALRQQAQARLAGVTGA